MFPVRATPAASPARWTSTNGALGLNGFDTALTKLAAHLALADDRVTVQHFTGASSKGGTFAVTGERHAGRGRGADLRLAAKDLILDESSGKSLLAKTYSTAFKGENQRPG